MTTAASFSTVDRLICEAMEDAGRLQHGDTPDSEMFAKYLNRFNDLVNFWTTQGLKLWSQSDLSVPLVAGTRDYTIGPGGSVNMTKPLRVLQGYYLDSSANRRPIYPLSWDEWLRLSTTTQQGQITQYFVNKRVATLNVSFWLVPDTTAATGTAHLLIQQQIARPISITETLDFPQETFIALRWMLADDIASGQPQAIMDRCKEKATVYRTTLENWDVEDAATSFSPDQRSGVYNSQFR